LKIFFPIGAFYPSQIGGPCNTLYWHTCALKSRGIEVNVVTTSLGLDDEKIVFDTPVNRDCGRVFYGSTPTVSLAVIKQIIKGIHTSDVIHLNSLFNILSIFSFFYAGIFFPKKKLIWSVRGELSPEALTFSQRKKKPLLFLYKRWTKNVLFHSTSEKETNEIKSFLPQAVVVEIPNFIAPAVRRKEGVEDVFLYLGRIHRIKALHKMIQGFALSQKFRDSNFKLFIAGKHEERHFDYYNEISQLIISLGLEDKVEMKGHITGEEKEKMYARSYAFILPSETENFGNVVLEALNQGTPVVASKGTPWSMLELHNCGYHISNDPNDIALAVDKMIGLPEEDYHKMRADAVLLVDKKFNVTTQIDKWIKIYNHEYTP